jgi:hypothetical protein
MQRLLNGVALRTHKSTQLVPTIPPTPSQTQRYIGIYYALNYGPCYQDFGRDRDRLLVKAAKIYYGCSTKLVQIGVRFQVLLSSREGVFSETGLPVRRVLENWVSGVATCAVWPMALHRIIYR